MYIVALYAILTINFSIDKYLYIYIVNIICKENNQCTISADLSYSIKKGENVQILDYLNNDALEYTVYISNYNENSSIKNFALL